MNYRILIAAGGTGGHFYPGFALAQELRTRGWQPLFLIKKDDISKPALEAAGLPYTEIEAIALPRSLNPAAQAVFLLKFYKSLSLARRIIADFSPCAAIGTGSYIAFPALLAARLAGVKTCIHESNAKFGLGNYLAGFFCNLVLLGLPIKDNPFSAKSRLTGTPVRATFSALPDKKAALTALGLETGRLTALIFGGSQGAARLNEAAVASAAALKGLCQFIHITGRGNFKNVIEAYTVAGLSSEPGLKVFDYREDMPALYAAADLVISRSGAGTVAELALMRKPALLVPLPSSAGGHQRANAMVLADKEGAVCLEEGADLAQRLILRLKEHLDNPAKTGEMAANINKTGIPDALQAAKLLADIIEYTTKITGRR